MSLMGIITNSKNEEYMVKELSDYFPSQNIIFITYKNIGNVRNIKFEILAIDCNIKNIDILKLIISNAKFIILNADLTINIGMLENLDLTIITYGFNNKATLTVSSVAENNIIICLQRIIKNIFEQKYEPQEFETKVDQNVDIHAVICIQSILLICKNKHLVLDENWQYLKKITFYVDKSKKK